MIFLVFLITFLVAFTFMVACLFTPIKKIETSTEQFQEADVVNNSDSFTWELLANRAKKSCRIPRKTRNLWHRSTNASNPDYDKYGRYVLPSTSSIDPDTNYLNFEVVITLFSTFYFAMFGMGGPEVIPRVLNGPSWHEVCFTM